ncbi:MAG: type II toxin-antitoxin system RelE/ParE family toxin [Planctomycetes bacterium]|nr:type II toxin-antitoxin system RelE/ParE family toxin [Planctomycetota bacterium]MBM4078229.1 type II toxin-antitoxin system RelE/ParE family toxin [Planctomycetota bacterium]
MECRVIIPRGVQKRLDDLPEAVGERVLNRILALRANPRPFGCVKLEGYEQEYRIRIGDYRVRYAIHDRESTVALVHCGHRKDAYRE